MSHIQRAVMALGMVVAWIPSSASWAQQDSPEILSERSHYDINVEYAKTRVQLAETELQLALESNRRTPGAVARIAVERLKSNLSIAEQQFREAKLSTVGGEERVRLRHVEEKIRLAKLDLENAEKLHAAGMAKDLEVQRCQLKYDLAKLDLQLLKHPQHFTTRLHYLEAKVERFGDEILALDQRISKLEPLRGVLP